MHYNDIQFSPPNVILLAENTKATEVAFACYWDKGNTVLVREHSYYLLETTGRCNGKNFSVLAGRSMVTGLMQFYLFSNDGVSVKERNSISSKVKRLLVRSNFTVNELARSELSHIHINQRLIALHKNYNLQDSAPTKITHPELFYLLHVSVTNIEKAIGLGAVLNAQLKRYMISVCHSNSSHPDLMQWLPENNPIFKLDNPKSIMRLNQLFKDCGALRVLNISNTGKVCIFDWVIYADHPTFDDMRIYISGSQFRTYINVSRHDSLKVRALGAIWDKRCAKFYIADIAENHRIFVKWLPANNPELLVYITTNNFKDVKGFDLFSIENNQYRRVYTDNLNLKEILECQERSILERDTLKKELILLHVGKNDRETVRKLGAVQQRVMRRLEWFISTDHPNYARLEQWLPERNPKRYLTDLSVEECKSIGGFFDIFTKQWFLYKKDYQPDFKKVS